MGALASDNRDSSRESWDVMLAVHGTQAKKWFIVFLDLKARKKLKGCKQAQYVQKMVQQVKQGKSSGGLLDALKDGRYCYLYISTAKGQNTASAQAIVLKEQDTTRFLGPLAAVHKAIRRAFPGPKT